MNEINAFLTETVAGLTTGSHATKYEYVDNIDMSPGTSFSALSGRQVRKTENFPKNMDLVYFPEKNFSTSSRNL